MSRRKIVKLDLPVVNSLIKSELRSYIVFCEKMGRAHNWVTDWNRRDKNGKPSPKNLPSPEEAARMCILLKTTPEEILLHEGETDEETAKCLEDIQRVKELVAELRKEEAPDPKIEGISAERKALLDIVYSLTDEQCRKLLGVVLEAKKLM